MDEKLRARLVELASELFHLAEEASAHFQTLEPHSYWQGLAFGLQMGVTEILGQLEDLSKSKESRSDQIDTLNAQVIAIAANLQKIAVEARQRGGKEPGAPVAPHDYWQGVSFGLEMVLSKLINLSMDLSKGRYS